MCRFFYDYMAHFTTAAEPLQQYHRIISRQYEERAEAMCEGCGDDVKSGIRR